MIRRISTKWVLSVLMAVVVPLVVSAWFVNGKVSALLAGDVVRYHLLSQAADLAVRVDDLVRERERDVAIAAGLQNLAWYLKDSPALENLVQGHLNALVVSPGMFAYAMVLDPDGHTVLINDVDADGMPLRPELVDFFRAVQYSYDDDAWFAEAMERGQAGIPWVRMDDVPSLEPGVAPLPGGYYVGWIHRIDDDDGAPLGCLAALMPWEYVQDLLEDFGVRQLVSGSVHTIGEDIYSSSYAWLWSADATILAHQDRSLYGASVNDLQSGGLRPMVEAALSSRWGSYPDYEFQGTTKKAAFWHCAEPEEGGFGWIVGIGVDDTDIYRPVRNMQTWLWTATGLTLALGVLLSLWVAHRTTRPIRALEAHTRRVGHGDLSARIEVRSKDELGDLARSFNRMLSELEANREQLVLAEKDKAWREMARQVAHEIKNPLTPISLSVGLLKRARDEQSPEFDAIFDRTIEMVQRQVENMREVVRDFYAFAGEHRNARPTDVGAVLSDVIGLHRAWAEERGIRVDAPPPPEAWVRADRDELHRALLNLVSNAIEAMPEGGRLLAEVTLTDDRVRVEVRDTGSGIPTEAAEHLFEPYFTTRSSGTGLGLAIVRRVIEDLGGSVRLENVVDGPGAVAVVVLPRLADGAHDGAHAE